MLSWWVLCCGLSLEVLAGQLAEHASLLRETTGLGIIDADWCVISYITHLGWLPYHLVFVGQWSFSFPSG